MGKEIVTQAQEAERVPYRINSRRNIPRHILFKLIKIKFKEKILKAAMEKQRIICKGIPIRLSAELFLLLFFSRNSAGQKRVAGYI